jgi:hypothetical protein
MVPRKPEGDRPERRPLIDEELADQLLGRAQAEDAELLGHEKHDPAGPGSGNNRNGTTGKSVLTDAGAVDLAVPRHRNGPLSRRSSARGQTRPKGSKSIVRSAPRKGRNASKQDCLDRGAVHQYARPGIVIRLSYRTIFGMCGRVPGGSGLWAGSSGRWARHRDHGQHRLRDGARRSPTRHPVAFGYRHLA